MSCSIRWTFAHQARSQSSRPAGAGAAIRGRPAPGWLGLAMVLGLLLTPAGAGAVQFSLVPLDPGIDPMDIVLDVGETIRLAVEVDDVPSPGLAAFQFEISFDPSIVELSNPNPSLDPFAPLGNNDLCWAVRGLPMGTCEDPDWLLTSTGRSPTGTHEIGGDYIVVAYGTSGSESLPTGPGALALVDVTGVGIGETDLSFSDLILADNSEPPDEYATTSVGAHLTVPEPSTASLVALGIVMVGLASRRGSHNRERC